MSSGRYRASGYSQRIFFGNGIEYTNYSEALIGQTSAEGNEGSIFTMNNFTITANIDSKPDKNFITNKFSKFNTLDNLNITPNGVQEILDNNTKIFLNLDPSEVSNYAYFGSMIEFVRVSLESIIMNWPASLFIDTIDNITTINTGNTVNNYTYDSLTDVATFQINTNYIFNPYGLNFLTNGNIISSFSTTNDLKILTTNYSSYVISGTSGEFNIIGFTGATNMANDVITIKTKGNVFATTSNTLSVRFHLKPNKENVEKFFNTLDTFQNNLLNRLSIPNYLSTFNYQVETDGGNTVLTQQSLIWPVSDGYNLDFNSTRYVNYVSDLLTIAEQSDETQSNLLTRFLTTKAISEFDTIPNDTGTKEVTEGQTMNKVLKIYGRSFDEIKQYIDGLAYSNTVTYDKKNNTPDMMLKTLSTVLGWNLMSPSEDNDIINHYLDTANSTYSGQSRGLTAAESEIELWRRLILNTPWLWKSKGTRKGIEFLFKFIGTPEGLVTFNEYIYTANKPLDINLFTDVVEKITGSRSITGMTIDSDGYPMTLPDTPEMYFQKGGLWYRETGGPNSNLDVLVGNNPHIGPYDAGSEYINQFNVLIPNFSSTTIVEEVITTGYTNLFLNYNEGIINGIPLTSTVYADIQAVNTTSEFGYDMIIGASLTSEVITDPFPEAPDLTCGCDVVADDLALKFDISQYGDGSQSVLQLILDSNINSGALFSVGPDDTCGVELKFDYLINHDCTNILEGVNEMLGCLNRNLSDDIFYRDQLMVQISTLESQIEVLEQRLGNALYVGEQRSIAYQIQDLELQLSNAREELAPTNARIVIETELSNAANDKPLLNFMSNFNVTVSLLKLTPFIPSPEDIAERLRLIALIASLESQIEILKQRLGNALYVGEQRSIAFQIQNLELQLADARESLRIVETRIYVTLPFKPYEDVYSEVIFDITKTEDFITNNQSTGLYLTGDNCGDLISAIHDELGTNCGILSADTFNSTWLSYSKVITDATIIEQITNSEIKIGLTVDWNLPVSSNCNTHKKYAILLDNIEINKICNNLKRTNIIVSKSPSFELARTIDNRKSWVSTDSKVNREYDFTGRDTSYDLNHSKLLVNTKEVDINIDGAHAIETNTAAYLNHYANNGIRFLDNGFYTGHTGFVFAEEHGLSVGDSINVVQDAGYLNESYNGITTIIDVPDLYTIVVNKDWGVATPANPGTVYNFFITDLTSDISNLNSTDDFIKIIISELIDVKNRKVLGAYPTLRQLYDKYLGLITTNCSTCNISSQYNYIDLETFSNLIGTYWVDLIEQVIPSTTIWGSTYVYRNTVFDAQSFKYKKSSSFFGQLPTGLPTTIATNSTVQVIVGDVSTTSTNADSCVIAPPSTQTLNGVTIVQVDNSSEFIGTVTII